MEELNQHLNSVKIPKGDVKIYKDECVFPFDTPAQINQNNDGLAEKITKLAIGTPGGFIPDEKKYTYDKTYEIIILPNFTSIKYPSVDLPEQV
ncbi:hypothetical protein HCN44_003366 [Aphidius gifuensis]|uniref:Ubiquitinyl hydrolase variant UBP zinc finger domain-containing protein n=1 Tax=Aphidius gifuensis TaxID=684658 RepID=A0A834Y0H4_APHGI|nr:hypothetical protein HCN44_003366 [Aphidius gifuensis]